MKRLQSPVEALHGLGAGSTVVLHSGCAQPPRLAGLLAANAPALAGARVLAMMPMGPCPYGDEGAAELLDVATFFPGRGLRAALGAGRVRAMRHPLSALPGLFDRGEIRADALLLQVSAPDETGHVSLGVSVDYMPAVLTQSPRIIAEVNPRMPRTFGPVRLHSSRLDVIVEGSGPVQEVAPAAVHETDRRIARHVAALVHDGAVLQVGIGALPDAVLHQLGHLRHLGLHTGIITDAARPLIEAGVLDNSRKQEFAGVSVTSMAAGTQSFYDFLHRNPAVEFHPCAHTHAAPVLAAIDGLCAINGALQVDLAGQVNAETVRGRRISMPGGMPDFALGATRSRGGTSIIALRSTFGKGLSTIVPRLDHDAPVTVPPLAVDFVVTEYGAAPVRGLSPRARAQALVAVAHPDHRESLERAFATRVEPECQP